MSRRAGLAAAGVALGVAATLGVAALLRSSGDVEELRAAIEARPNSLVLLGP